MDTAQKKDIYGSKGGENKPKTPIEAPDSLRSTAVAKILIAVGEGEFEGTPTTQDIFLDGTPLADAHGNLNFPNVKWEWRTGSVEQPYIQGIPSVENEITLGIELRSDRPWIKAITNTELSACRLRFAWPALQSVDQTGNINGYRIEYKVEVAIDGGAYQEVLSEAVDGKTTSTYERTRRIDLPKATDGWLIRVTRLTANQNNNKIADMMQISGFTEVIDAKIQYRNTALLYIEFSAEQFRSIPVVTVQCKARRVQVPANYDPIARSYTGIWNGTFKLSWTDNPAWITYDITLNDRFGLGQRIKPWQVDRWELYRISQYSDQLVPDGRGGMEPRFSCALNLQVKADAWSLLRDISSIYRGMTYWAQGQVFTLADMPRATDFDFAYVRANVIDGKFTYSGTTERSKFSRALISYDNPSNQYDTDVTSVTNPRLQRRFGDNLLELSAIGCTRESEAQRRGKWALLTNSKDRGVTFKVGLDGRIPLPGYVIPIADELLAGRHFGGRIAAASGRTVTLDRDTLAKAGDRLIVNLPNGKCEGRTVQSVALRKVTVTTAYSVPPAVELVWALDADDLAVPLYRVTAVKRADIGIYEITAVQYDPSKFANIDTGARLDDRPISVIPITVVPAPANVTLHSNSTVAQGLAVTTVTIDWPAVVGAVAYDVQWRKDSGNWISMPRTGTASVEIVGIYAGAYLARVRSVSAFDISSIWKISVPTQLNGKEGLPPAVTSLTATSLLFGIGLAWTFPPGAEDTQRTEIWYGPTPAIAAATKLTDLSYPQADYVLQNLRAGASFFFWARLVDRTGNIGPFFPVDNGVQGLSSTDAGLVLNLIAGQISETELGQSLTSAIDLIDGDGPGSVNARLSDLKNQIGDLVDALAYVPTNSYVRDNTVRVGNNLWTAVANVPEAADGTNGPPNGTYWVNSGQSSSTANAMVAQVAKNTADISIVDGKTTANAQQISAIQATVNDPVTGVDASASGLNSLKGTVTTLDGAVQAQAGATQSLNASVRGGDDEGSLAAALQAWTSTASIAQESNARATGELAIATTTTHLQASINSTNSAVQTVTAAQAASDGKASASWQVKLQVNSQGQYVAAGIGLGIENTPAGLQSQFLVSADRFAVVNGINGALSSPFAVTGGQVFINQGFIKDGTITNAKIGSYISSTNYLAGQSGWILNKNGTLEINGSVAGGGRLVVTNRSVRVYDASGVKRVQLGDLNE